LTQKPVEQDSGSTQLPPAGIPVRVGVTVGVIVGV
jgi:hypothetical protein